MTAGRHDAAPRSARARLFAPLDPPWDPARLRGPRCAAIADLAARFPAGALPSASELDRGLRDLLAPAGLALVAAEPARARDDRYELRCAEQGQIPCRPGSLHDVCNALSWAAFPRAKQRSTARIAERLRRQLEAGPLLPGARDREHDRLALIDEGGLLALLGPTPLVVVVGHAIWQHEAQGVRAVRAARAELPRRAAQPEPTEASAVRAEIDEAWYELLATSQTLEAGMGQRAGVEPEDGELWRTPTP